MNKRYQVFVSSTYEDLKDERLEVMKALLELDCIPCGMEYFPAANEDAWTFITNLIDTCDYYVVIVSGCYGSEDAEGKSYTQKEYEYALSKEIPTIGFIHQDRSSLPPEKQETDPEKIRKLADFIQLVESKLCKKWSNAYELGAVVSRSLTQLMKANPRTGWVRADKIGSEELLGEINTLRKNNQLLQEKVTKLESENSLDIDISNIAFEESISPKGSYATSGRISNWSFPMTWKSLFITISPYLMTGFNEMTARTQFASSILNLHEQYHHYTHEQLDVDFLQSVKVQYLALGLIQIDIQNTVAGGTGVFWWLTQKGKSIMLQERSIKKQPPAGNFFRKP